MPWSSGIRGGAVPRFAGSAAPKRQTRGTMSSVVNHVGLCVADPARSRSFYENVFGFRHRRTLEVADEAAATLLQVAPPVGLTAVYLELDGFVLELLHFDREGNDAARLRSFTEPGLTHLSFGAPDVAATCELVRAYGGQVTEGTGADRVALPVPGPEGQPPGLAPRPAATPSTFSST